MFVRGRNLGVRSQRRGTKLEEDSDWTEEAERNFNCGPIAGASEAQLMPKRKTEDKAVQGSAKEVRSSNEVEMKTKRVSS